MPDQGGGASPTSFLLFLLAILTLVSVLAPQVSSTNYHDASEVMVNVNGTDRDLQYVFDNDFFDSDLRDRRGLVFSSPSSIHHGKHQAIEILVSSGGRMGTLLSYLKNKTLPSGFSRDRSIATHPATAVFFSSGKSLQELVDAGGKFSCTPRPYYCDGPWRLFRTADCSTPGYACNFGCSNGNCNTDPSFPHDFYLDAYESFACLLPNLPNYLCPLPDYPPGSPLPASSDSGSCSAGWFCNGTWTVYRMSNCSFDRSSLFVDCLAGCSNGKCIESFQECGDGINECDSGVWTDRRDTNNYHSWFCGGRPCIKEKSAVRGMCNNGVLNGCRQGDPFGSRDNSTHYRWHCTGTTGESDQCSKAKSLASPSCNFEQQGCNSGNYLGRAGTFVNYFYNEKRWNCYNSQTCVGCRKSLFSSGTFSC